MKTYPKAMKPGETIRHYVLKSVLGTGSFGITYLAENTRNDSTVAIKEFFPSLFGALRGTDGRVISPPENFDKVEKCLESFRQEASTLVSVKHKNIVHVYEYMAVNNTGYIVMEHVVGKPLFVDQDESKPLTDAILTPFIEGMCAGLKAIHAAGIIHRDLKPSNVLVRSDGSPVLIDFGSAREFANSANNTLTSFLTPGYSPFEQYLGSSTAQGPWTDIYALGAMIYRMIAGEKPPDSIVRSNAMVTRFPDPIKNLYNLDSHQISSGLLDLTYKALSVKETDRPQSIDEFMRLFNLCCKAVKPVAVQKTRDEKNNILRLINDSSFFDHFTTAEKNSILKHHSRIKRFEKGAFITKTNQPGKSFYILLEGYALVLDSERSTPIAKLRPGQIFGEIAFLNNRRRTTDIIADSLCTLVQVDNQLLNDLGAVIREKIKDRILENVFERMGESNRRLRIFTQASEALLNAHRELTIEQL